MKTLEDLQQQKSELEYKIRKLRMHDAHFEEVRKYFPSGQVGHAGHNAKKLEARRTKSAERIVDDAVALRALYRELQGIDYAIESIKSGKTEMQKNAKERLRENIQNMQVGGVVLHGGFGQAGIVEKVNVKSFRVKVHDTGKLETWSKEMITKAALPKGAHP